MTRFGTFTDFDVEHIEDVQTIVDDNSYPADVYRLQAVGVNPGFSDEIGDEVLIDKIMVSIHQIRGVNNLKQARSDGPRGSKTKFVILTISQNIELDDTIVIQEEKYRVISTDRGTPKTEVIVERFS